jgi:cytochrome c peroxidase
MVLCLLAAAQATAQTPDLPGDDEIRRTFGLQAMPPIPYPQNNRFNPDRQELGRLLFFDPIFSGEKDTACGTCHIPKFGMADGRQLGAGTTGVGLGPDRVLGFSKVTGDTVIAEARHTMTIFNTGLNGDASGQPSAKGLMLWDGKDQGLEAQALRPIIVRVELRGDAFKREYAVDSVLTRLRGIPEYVELFRQAFPQEADSVDQQIPRLACLWDPTPLQSVITRSTLGRALAAFERELVTKNSPYDRYVAGDDGALAPQEKAGLVLFHTKAKCTACHSGPLFTDSSFRVQGVEQIGPGQGLSSTQTGTPRPSGMDRGRFVTSGNRDELFAFRTVTLRQIGATAPYMHDGALETLADVIEFYDRGGGDEETIPEDRIDAELVPLGLSAQEKAQLEAFLLALTDPTMEVRVPERVPSGLPPAGLELQQEGESVSSMTAQESLAAAPSSMAWAARVSSFPNPFNAETNIEVDLGQAGKVDLVLFDLLGRPVRRLAQGIYPAGSHVFRWDGRDDDQRPAASGVYLVRLTVQGTRRTSRLTLLR